MKPSPEAMRTASEWLAPRVRVSTAEVESLAVAIDALVTARRVEWDATFAQELQNESDDTRASIVRFLRRLGNEYSNDANWHADRIEAREDEREEPK